ncbi:shikimate dehydrogenase [Demequina lutea]|uniref:Shikimate dehydrogenase n=1 Tax=Demequina lutea TaxID=431489 RepID=A0A7Y9Z9N1_9MICO|nr:shikimate dehydrogenase [Demequina lutea]
MLGLDWSYEAIDVDTPDLATFLSSRGDEWVGFSLTMPLKAEAARLADFVEPQAKLLGTVNTLVPAGKGEYRHWVGANSDIHGMVAAFAEADAVRVGEAVIVGGGATATSAVAALASMGATAPYVLLRDRARAGALMRAASRMGVKPRFLNIASQEGLAALSRADAVMSTVPAEAGAALAARIHESGTRVRGVLLDAVYVPVSTPLSLAWGELGGVSVSGVRMLLHQAGEQVRLMTGQSAPVEAMDLALAKVLTNS